ncbi:MAG: hypothetical protein KGI79_01880 [Patescibacteria group bacterium]|nr:hypothetical protein [Patescibacteria group bacterium]MDE2116601.1 hypothetical protein [Patescibacteria group bacterium]
MTKAKIFICLVIVLLAVYATFVLDIPYRKVPDETAMVATTTSSLPATSTADEVFLEWPDAEATISSPVAISGQARGAWYFEAVFPVEIIAADGSTTLGTAQARAQSSWTTGDFVPWRATVAFDPKANTSGFIRLLKDNPSGDPTRAEHIDIPVIFAPASTTAAP